MTIHMRGNEEALVFKTVDLREWVAALNEHLGWLEGVEAFGKRRVRQALPGSKFKLRELCNFLEDKLEKQEGAEHSARAKANLETEQLRVQKQDMRDAFIQIWQHVSSDLNSSAGSHIRWICEQHVPELAGPPEGAWGKLPERMPPKDPPPGFWQNPPGQEHRWWPKDTLEEHAGGTYTGKAEPPKPFTVVPTPSGVAGVDVPAAVAGVSGKEEDEA